jgi:SAM-dependent methyltransferase
MNTSTRYRSATHASGLARQFGRPSGLIGRLVGHAMALEHRRLHREVMERLHLEPDDAVLEIGFGPGTALGLAAERASWVAGVDVSPVMVNQALRRNRKAVREGRIEVRLGSATALPFPDSCFTVVFEVNSLHHWEDPARGLAEVRRVLRPAGRLLLTLRDGCETAAMEELKLISPILTGLGFNDLRGEAHALGGHGGLFVAASLPQAQP